ncbi:MAG: hypothetical protein ACTSPQ_06690 [Candidatus Helarchaeota archaeon]
MIKDFHLIQKDLYDSIKIVIPTHPIDIGKFTTKSLKSILFDEKKELEIDFDDIRIYPGQQPRESMDVELIKNKEIVGKLNVKTAVSGNLESTIRKLISSTKRGCIGTLILLSLFYKNEKNIIPKMIIILIPEDILSFYRPTMIEEAIRSKLDQKIKKEKYNKYEILAFNDAIEFERVRDTIRAVEIAIESKEITSQIFNLATEAKKEATEAKKEAMEAKKEATEAKKEAMEAKKEATEAKKEATEAKKEAMEAKKEATEAKKEAMEAKKEAIEIKKIVERIDNKLDIIIKSKNKENI